MKTMTIVMLTVISIATIIRAKNAWLLKRNNRRMMERQKEKQRAEEVVEA